MIRVSQNWGCLIGVLHNKDEVCLGSILGPPSMEDTICTAA